MSERLGPRRRRICGVRSAEIGSTESCPQRGGEGRVDGILFWMHGGKPPFPATKQCGPALPSPLPVRRHRGTHGVPNDIGGCFPRRKIQGRAARARAARGRKSCREASKPLTHATFLT